MDASVCASAAGGGHLEVLKWASCLNVVVMNGGSICERAAAGGHLEVLFHFFAFLCVVRVCA